MFYDDNLLPLISAFMNTVKIYWDIKVHYNVFWYDVLLLLYQGF
jgi:uncharacterized protein YcfL